MRRNKKNSVKNFKLLFILVVAVGLIIALGIVALLAYIFDSIELLKIYMNPQEAWFIILIWVVTSITIGLIISYAFSLIIMKPIHELIDGMTSLADGIYDISINARKSSPLKELSTSFNNLAIELKKNELLSANFINNFSHEIKTPIVSISGLISLMKHPDISEEKKNEYLEIIEEEANRLASLTTNILSLSKIENQTIVTEKERFNISEQIRNCVLLFEKRWMKKNLNISLDLDEFYMYGNMDLVMQIWINLLDNAIKFAYNDSELLIDINEDDNKLNIKISNECDTIDSADLEKIFNKFYQVEKTHRVEGNGIGLSIVKKIVELHNGTIRVESVDNKVIFIIELHKQ